MGSQHAPRPAPRRLQEEHLCGWVPAGRAGFSGNSFHLKEQLTGSCGYSDLGAGQTFP